MIWLVLGFVLGLFVGTCVGWLFYIRQRRKNVQIDEEKQLIHQEKQIVVEFMHNLVEAIGAGVGREELFQHIVHASILSTGALSACIFERTGKDKLRGIAVEGLFPPQHPLPEKTLDRLSTRSKFIEQILKSEVFEMGEGLIGSVARTGKAVLIEDATGDPRVIQHEDSALKVRSLVIAPLAFRSKILGVLAVANPADGVAFNETDFSLVQSLAEQAAMAIHNSDLMEMQIEKSKLDLDIAVASSIQGMILPQTFPANTGLDIDAFYRPAQKIGGDLYNVIKLDESRIGVAIADVSGKGVPASLLMTICQTNLRHFAQSFRSPSEVLKAMNREMSEEIRRDMFITIIYAIFDTANDTLTLARAGHELPLVCVHAEGQAKPELNFVGSEGMALGMVTADIFDFVIEDCTVPFRRGDIAVLYTDGVTEAADEEGTEFASSRLAESVRVLRDRSAHAINAGIVSTVERYTGQSKFADDLTLITLKRT